MVGQPLIPALLSVFFALASLICLTAAVSLLAPDMPLRGMWEIKPDEYRQLLALAPWSGVGFFGLAGLMAVASFGTGKRTHWGWWLANAIFAINGAADAARLFSGANVEGAVGVVVAGAILIALSRSSVRRLFDR